MREQRQVKIFNASGTALLIVKKAMRRRTTNLVSYLFDGVSIEGSAEGSEAGEVHLEGTMIKFVIKQKAAQTRLRFTPFVIME